MGQCIGCSKKGFMLRIDQNGMCKECQDTIWPRIQEELNKVREAEQAFSHSETWKQELHACDAAAQALEELSRWESRGIRTGLSQPAEHMRQQVDGMRRQFVEKAVQQAYANADRNIQATKSPEERVIAAKVGLDEISSIQFLGGHTPAMDVSRKKLHEVYDKLQYKIYALKAKAAEEMKEHEDAREAYKQSVLYLRECLHMDEKYKDVLKKLELKITAMDLAIEEKKAKQREKKMRNR